MRNFQPLGTLPINLVNSAIEQLLENSQLWNDNKERTTSESNEHREVDDIWLRYAAKDKLEEHKLPHIPVWYPSWHILTEIKPLVLSIAGVANAEMIGGVLITKVPVGKQVYPHVDTGWHVDFYDKIYVQLQGNKDQSFYCEDEHGIEKFSPKTGDVYLFDNRKKHWVINGSDEDRMTLIICVRTELFGRK